MTTILNEQDLEAFSRAASLASVMVDELPDLAEEANADIGVLALVMCGLLAGRLVSSGLDRAECIRQINLAIDAKAMADRMSKSTQ